MNENRTGPFDNSGDKNRSGPQANRIELWRFRVAEVYATGALINTLRCHTWNGNVEGKTDYFVEKAIGHQIGHIIYAYRPLGGTSASTPNPQQPSCEWREMLQLPGNPRRWDVLMCIDDAGTLAWGRPRFTNER
jgi:hypothetical protein